MDSQITDLQNKLADMQGRLDVIQHQNSRYDDARVNLFDIFGTFPGITQAPTVVPSTPYDQVQIATISGTTYLYVYDTLNNGWKRVTIA
jgi:hypothetical protein